MNGLGSQSKRGAAAGAVAAALFFLHPGPAGALEDWLRGTATASAHDKALAHELAYERVQQQLLAECSGPLGGPIEEKAAYAYVAVTDEWRATVTLRASCDFLDDSR